MCLSVTWEYSACPCLSLRVNIYRMSETTVPPCPPTCPCIVNSTSCFFYIRYHIHLRAWMCMDTYTTAGTPCKVASQHTGGSWGLNWGLVAPLNHLHSPSSSNVFNSTITVLPIWLFVSQYGLIIKSASTWQPHPLYENHLTSTLPGPKTWSAAAQIF